MTREEKIQNLIAKIQLLRLDWTDLGWDVDGCPDGEKCDEFENQLIELDNLAYSIDKN
jgi:hypothetical protein